jgi:hypothetical protein
VQGNGSKIDQTGSARGFKVRQKAQSGARRWTVSKQFENPEEAQVEDETIAEESADEKIQHVADKAAGRAAKTEREYEKDHTIFTN